METKVRLVRLVWIVCPAMTVVLAHATHPIAAGAYRLNAEPDDLRADLTERFEFAWDSVQLLSEVHAQGDSNAPARTVTISVRLKILDANGLLAMDVSNPVIFKVVDESENALHWRGDAPGNTRQYCRVGTQGVVEGTRYVDKIIPSCTAIGLPLDSGYPLPSSLASVKGYLYVLYVDRIINVDIPYDPNGGWVEPETAPDLTLCVDPTTPPPPGEVEYMVIPPPLVPLVSPYFDPRATPIRRKAVSLCYYFTWVKSKTGRPIMALDDVWYPLAERALVEHVVIETQLSDSKRNTGIQFQTEQTTRSDGGRGALCHGWPWQDLGPFDTIRHVIGVHPVEVKIPFVLKNVPIPHTKGALTGASQGGLRGKPAETGGNRGQAPIKKPYRPN